MFIYLIKEKKIYIYIYIYATWVVGIFIQPTMWWLKNSFIYTYSHMLFLINHVTYLNNTTDVFYFEAVNITFMYIIWLKIRKQRSKS